MCFKEIQIHKCGKLKEKKYKLKTENLRINYKIRLFL